MKRAVTDSLTALSARSTHFEDAFGVVAAECLCGFSELGAHWNTRLSFIVEEPYAVVIMFEVYDDE